MVSENSQTVYAITVQLNGNTRAANTHWYLADWSSLSINFVLPTAVQLLQKVLMQRLCKLDNGWEIPLTYLHWIFVWNLADLLPRASNFWPDFWKIFSLPNTSNMPVWRLVKFQFKMNHQYRKIKLMNVYICYQAIYHLIHMTGIRYAVN